MSYVMTLHIFQDPTVSAEGEQQKVSLFSAPGFITQRYNQLILRPLTAIKMSNDTGPKAVLLWSFRNIKERT